MNVTSIPCIIEANSDVTGPGIRAFVYSISLARPLFALIPANYISQDDYGEFRHTLHSTLGFQGIALLCTLIYQAKHKTLTLFHAICAGHLLALLGLNLMSGGRYRVVGPVRFWTGSVLNLFAIIAYAVFNLFVYSTASQFGSQQACNASTVFVAFYWSVSAISPAFRWVMIFIFVSILLVVVWSMTVLFGSLCCFLVLRRRSPENVSIEQMSPDSCGREIPWVKSTVGIVFAVYVIVSLEQTVRRNHVAMVEQRWNFGQIFSLFMLVGIGRELAFLILASIDNRYMRPTTG